MASKKFLSLLSIFLIIIVALSSVVVYQNLVTPNSAEAKVPDVLGVTISPAGQSFQLGVNSSKTFIPQVSNGTGPFTYTWSISPTGNFNLSINDEVVSLVNASTVEFSSASLTLEFPYAVENEFVQVAVSVVDATGTEGESYSIMVADPYTSPGYKFDASIATAAVVCRADGLGWYRAYDGLTGAKIAALDSTNPDTTLDGALLAYAGKTVYVDGGSWVGAVLAVPANTVLIADPSTTGIKYGSIGNGARIDEPNFNAAFGGYVGGTYSIVANQSSVASTTSLYFAFKPDNSIYWVSSNASYPAQTALNSKPNIKFAEGTFVVASAIAVPSAAFIDGSGWQTMLSGDNIFTVAAKTNWTIQNLYMHGSTTGGHTAISIAGASTGGRLLNCKTDNYIRSWYHDTTGQTVDGVVRGCVFLNGRSADWAPVFDYNVANFEVSSNKFEDCLGAGTYIAGGNSLRIVNNNYDNCSYSKTDFAAIFVTNRVNMSDFIVSDNTITLPALDTAHIHGIVIAGEFTSTATTSDGLVENNVIRGISTNNNCGNGIYLAGQTNTKNIFNIIIQGNSVRNTTRGIILSETKNVTISDNTLRSLSVLPISYDDKNINLTISGNVGYNPVGYLANPFTGSNTEMYNTGSNATMTSDMTYTVCGSARTIYVSGGTVTAITVNGQATGLTSGTIVLQPMDTFSITFSSAPTLKVMVH